MERDVIIQFNNGNRYDIYKYPTLMKASNHWRTYAGNCYRGFTNMTDQQLKELFSKELDINCEDIDIIVPANFRFMF